MIAQAWDKPSTSKRDEAMTPEHYKGVLGVPDIEIIAAAMTEEMFRGFCFGNSLKYRLRIGKKDDVSSELKKIKDYPDVFEEFKHLCRK